jgi:hypothetical protein
MQTVSLPLVSHVLPKPSRSRQVFSLWREGLVFTVDMVNATMATMDSGRAKKGKNFSVEEERGLCRSFLVVSQDPICGNGQPNTAFWERITTHYNQTKAKGSPVRPAQSLETKWGNIKHDVGKFCGCYK